MQCPAGHHSPETGSNECQACPGGTFLDPTTAQTLQLQQRRRLQPTEAPPPAAPTPALPTGTLPPAELRINSAAELRTLLTPSLTSAPSVLVRLGAGRALEHRIPGMEVGMRILLTRDYLLITPYSSLRTPYSVLRTHHTLLVSLYCCSFAADR